MPKQLSVTLVKLRLQESVLQNISLACKAIMNIINVIKFWKTYHLRTYK